MQGETTSRSDWYRGRAADCLALAERAPSGPAKAMLANMAAKWLKLAELVHKWEDGDGGGCPPDAETG